MDGFENLSAMEIDPNGSIQDLLAAGGEGEDGEGGDGSGVGGGLGGMGGMMQDLAFSVSFSIFRLGCFLGYCWFGGFWGWWEGLLLQGEKVKERAKC